MPDTGCSQTIISEAAANLAGLDIRESDQGCRNASGEQMDIVGVADFRVANNRGDTVSSEALISRRQCDDLMLSWHHMARIGLLPRDWAERVAALDVRRPAAARAVTQVTAAAASAEASQLKEELFSLYANDVISDELSMTPMDVGGPMHIDMKDDVRPAYVRYAATLALFLCLSKCLSACLSFTLPIFVCLLL